MRYSTTTGLVLAALGVGEVMAGPAHAHLHKKAHQKKDLADVDWNNLGIDWSSAWAAGQSTTAAPTATAAATTTKPAPAAATTTAAPAVFKEKAPSAKGIADDIEDLWNDLVGCSNSRTSFGAKNILKGGSAGGAGLAGDFENGNIGMPYGSNVIKVDSTSGYDFTATFVNTQKKTISINIWNKGGPDMAPLSGASLAPKETTLTFSLAPGKTQIVAFDDVSYVAWAEPCDARTGSGSFGTTWGEAKFQSTGSGFDVSAITNNNGNDYNMIMSAKEVSCVSDMNQNMWLTPTKPVGGSNGSCYVPGSTMHLTVKMGGRQ